jgi:hypothetical protein
MAWAADRVAALVADCLRDLRADLNLPPLPALGPDTVLFGAGGALDSMGLVHFLAELELRLHESFGGDWLLADERAMSRRSSPFRTVGSLCEFIAESAPHNHD